MMVGGPPSMQSVPAKTVPTITKHSNSISTLEGGTAQIRKKPQKKKKKRVPRRTIKVMPHSRRRPPKTTAQQKLRKGRNNTGGNLKAPESTVYTPNLETRLKKCYCGFLSTFSKNPLESGLKSVPPKASKQPNLSQPYSSAAKAEERNLPIKQGGKAENDTRELWHRGEWYKGVASKELIGTMANDRKLNPITPVKRRYHTVSVYQFIYPEKSMYHCNRDMVKQQLRAIYLNNRKKIKQHRTTVSQPEVNPPQRGSNGQDPRCPMGCEFLRSIQNSVTLHRLPNLMCKINNLGLLSGKSQSTAQQSWFGKEHLPQAHYPLASKQPSLLVEGLQRPNSPEGQISPESCCGVGQGQGCQVGALLKENGLTALGCNESPKLSSLLNKDCNGIGPDSLLGEKNQHVGCPEEEDGAHNAHCNVKTINAESN